MEIRQKKLSNKHIFTFNDETFNFAYEDKTGSGDVDIHYADFPQKHSISIEQNEWLKNVGYLWCAIGGFLLGHAIYTDSSLSGKGFWLMVGIVCVVWAQFTKVKYSVFKAKQGTVFVIKDAKHDEIINELNSRRKKQLLDWYGEINMENDLQKEINKFNWLSEQKIITKEEADLKIAQVELAHKDNYELPGKRLN